MIDRLELLYRKTNDPKINEFIKEAESWRSNAVGLTKEQAKK